MATIFMFFVSVLIVGPIILNLGYTSVESSYHLETHALLISLIFIVILCTMIIVEEFNKLK